MRYAIFSDVHSNLEAFMSVIKAMKREKIDKYICGGDIIGYGADPSKCIELTRRLTDNVISGNHDWASAGIFDTSYFNEYAKKAVFWTNEVLNETERTYLKNLKLIHKEKSFVVVHGSLDEPERFHYILNLNDAFRTFNIMDGKLCFVAHSHSPIVFKKHEEDITCAKETALKLDKDTLYIINVGSVGQVRDGDPRACYVIYDESDNAIEIKRVPYDIKKAQEKIIKAGLPSFLAERLSMGR